MKEKLMQANESWGAMCCGTAALRLNGGLSKDASWDRRQTWGAEKNRRSRVAPSRSLPRPKTADPQETGLWMMVALASFAAVGYAFVMGGDFVRQWERVSGIFMK